MEEAVHRLGQAVPNPSDRRTCWCGCAVGDFPQVFERVPFGGHGIGVWIFDQAHHFHFGRLHLDGLALALALGQDSATHDRTAGGQGLDFRVVGEIALGDHLQGVKARTVVDRQEGQPRLGVPPGADPSPDFHGVADGRRQQNLRDRVPPHGSSSPFWG